MKEEELLKQVFDYLDSFQKPSDQRGKITNLRCVINMIEEGVNWKDIREGLILNGLLESLEGKEIL